MTSTTTARRPIPFTDDCGLDCYRVPLDDHGRDFALIERADYDHVVSDLGASATWYLTGNGSGRRYVAVNPPRIGGRTIGLITVPRLFAGVGARQCVRYAGKDTRDLRRSNLIIKPGTGRARHDCAQRMREAARRRDTAKAA